MCCDSLGQHKLHKDGRACHHQQQQDHFVKRHGEIQCRLGIADSLAAFTVQHKVALHSVGSSFVDHCQ